MRTPTGKSGAVEERHQSIFDDVSGLIDTLSSPLRERRHDRCLLAGWTVHRGVRAIRRGAAEYRAALIEKLAGGLKKRFVRGFSRQNIWQMRLFYQTYPPQRILQPPSGQSTTLPSSSNSETVHLTLGHTRSYRWKQNSNISNLFRA